MDVLSKKKARCLTRQRTMDCTLSAGLKFHESFWKQEQLQTCTVRLWICNQLLLGHLTSGKSTPRELKIVLWNGDPNESDMGEAEEPVAGELLLTTVPSLLSLVKGVLALISRCSKSWGVDRTRLMWDDRTWSWSIPFSGDWHYNHSYAFGVFRYVRAL